MTEPRLPLQAAADLKAGDLHALIRGLIKAKEGDKEFMLHCSYSGNWLAAIGNTSQHCPIGEMLAYGAENVDFEAEGDGPFEAVVALYLKVIGEKK